MANGKSGRKAASQLILILGGAASGKSEMALRMAGDGQPRAFVATGQAFDQEMADRIERHRSRRTSEWETAEIPVHVPQWFRAHGSKYRVIILDCLTLWLNNLSRLYGTDETIFNRTSALLEAVRRTSARVIVVTNEVGLGLVPMEAGSRRFRDLAGNMNQQVAMDADEVHLVVSGQPVRLK